MSNQEIIDLWLTKVKFDLVNEYDRQGRRASGKFEEGLELLSSNRSAEILSYSYAEQLELGRGKTVKSGSGSVKEAIEQWIKDKNITPSDGITNNSLVYLITRKIHEKGIARKEPLVSKIITAERIQELIDSVFLLNLQQLETDIFNLFTKKITDGLISRDNSRHSIRQ